MTTSPSLAHATPSSASDALVSSGLIPALILIGGVVNGLAVRVLEAIRVNGADTFLFGISPFELITVAVAGHLLMTSTDARQRIIGWPEVAALVLLLVPSSAVSWLAVTFYGCWLALNSTGNQRIAAALFAALGAASLWASVLMNWFAAPITTVEAHIVTTLLQAVKSDVTVSANLMGVVGGHQVLLLPACASAYLIPKVIVALAAIAVFLGAPLSLRQFASLVFATALTLALLNWVRLAIMTWSYDLYSLAHGPIGANIFDLLQTALIIAAGMWASR